MASALILQYACEYLWRVDILSNDCTYISHQPLIRNGSTNNRLINANLKILLQNLKCFLSSNSAFSVHFFVYFCYFQPPVEAVEVESNRLPSMDWSEWECLERQFQGNTREVSRSLFRGASELGKRVHNAIKLKALNHPRFLVKDCGAPLEETNDLTMTPLYSTGFSSRTDGALLLLRHGADVVHADQTLSGSSCSFSSLVILEMKSGNLELFK